MNHENSHEGTKTRKEEAAAGISLQTPHRLIPKLRFPEFRGAAGWGEKSIFSVAALKNGYAFKSSSYMDLGPHRVITIGNVQSGVLLLEGTNGIGTVPDDIQPHQQLKIGDILISMTGNVGRVCRVTQPNCLLNQRVGKLVVDSIDDAFFYHVLQNESFRSAMQQRAAGGAQGNLSSTAITTYAFGVPPSLPEQQKIATCLTSFDNLIVAHSQKLDALKTHKKGLMQQLFPREGETIPRLRFPEFRDAPEWKERMLADACQMQAGKFVAASDILEHLGKGLFPCYGGNGLRGYTRTFTHAGKYPLVGRQGALCGNVKFGIGQFHATEHALVATPNAGIDVDWLFYALAFLNLNKFATGQAQPGLSVDVLEKVHLAIPEQESEQHRIASCLTSLDDLIAAQAQKVEALKTHKRGLMQQLFPSPEATGAIQVSPLLPEATGAIQVSPLLPEATGAIQVSPLLPEGGS